MTITVKYFASLREQAGKAEEILSCKPGMTPRIIWGEVMQGQVMPESIKVAINLDYSQPDTVVEDGDEVAFFPAVTGG